MSERLNAEQSELRRILVFERSHGRLSLSLHGLAQSVIRMLDPEVIGLRERADRERGFDLRIREIRAKIDSYRDASVAEIEEEMMLERNLHSTEASRNRQRRKEEARIAAALAQLIAWDAPSGFDEVRHEMVSILVDAAAKMKSHDGVPVVINEDVEAYRQRQMRAKAVLLDKALGDRRENAVALDQMRSREAALTLVASQLFKMTQGHPPTAGSMVEKPHAQ